jgi:hypothetical protein
MKELFSSDKTDTLKGKADNFACGTGYCRHGPKSPVTRTILLPFFVNSVIMSLFF